MIESLAFAVRAALGAALAVSMLRLVLRRAGRGSAVAATGHALALAIAASVVLALVIGSVVSRTSFEVEAALSLTLAAATAWVLRDARRLPAGLGAPAAPSSGAGHPAAAAAAPLADGWTAGLLALGLGAIAGSQVVGRALEVMAGEGRSAPGQLAALGVGLGACFFTGAALSRVLGSLPPEALRRGLVIALLGVLAGHLLAAWQALAITGRLPATSSSLAVVSLVIAAALPALGAAAHVAIALAGPGSGRAALLTAASLLMLVLAGERIAAQREMTAALPRATPARIESGAVRLPLSDLSAKAPRAYEVSLDGRPVRILAWLEGPRGMACVDACASCGSAGHAPVGRRIACLGCGAELPLAALGHPGGCRPLPLETSTAAGQLAIARSELERALAAR